MRRAAAVGGAGGRRHRCTPLVQRQLMAAGVVKHQRLAGGMVEDDVGQSGGGQRGGEQRR